MKEFFKNMLQAYRGKCDGLVYYYNPRLNRMVARPHVKRRETEQNRLFAAIGANLKLIQPSEGFKRDLADYCDKYNRKARNYTRPLNNWYNAFTKMMWALAKTHSLEGLTPPEAGTPIDLRTLSRADIESNDLPCRSVKRAVEAGLLEPVPGYELLDKLM